MKKFLLALVAFVGFTTVSFADEYTVNDNAIDDLFATATELSAQEMVSVGFNALQGIQGTSAVDQISASNPNPWVATIICFFLGGIAIHRVYLGTDNLNILWYFITCGGIFGIVPLVDFVCLIIGGATGDYGQYVGNRSFFMWL